MTKERFIEIGVEHGYSENVAEALWDSDRNENSAGLTESGVAYAFAGLKKRYGIPLIEKAYEDKFKKKAR